MALNGQTVLVTGGTGSFGKNFIGTLLTQHKPKKVIIFSRDELKQSEMMQQYANHPVLRWRDPVYKSVRELAISYFNEYFLWDTAHNNKKVPHNKKGTKTLRAYSKPFALMRYKPEDWWAAKDLDWKRDQQRLFKKG